MLFRSEMVRAAIYKEYFAQEKKKENVLPHAQTYDYLKNVVVNGDVREILEFVPDESIHLTFTSPPYYNARDYSIYPSYEAYLNFLEEVFLGTYRIPPCAWAENFHHHRRHCQQGGGVPALNRWLHLHHRPHVPIRCCQRGALHLLYHCRHPANHKHKSIKPVRTPPANIQTQMIMSTQSIDSVWSSKIENKSSKFTHNSVPEM